MNPFLLKYFIFADQISLQRDKDEISSVIAHIGRLDVIYLPGNYNGSDDQNNGKHELKNDKRFAKPQGVVRKFKGALQNPHRF